MKVRLLFITGNQRKQGEQIFYHEEQDQTETQVGSDSSKENSEPNKKLLLKKQNFTEEPQPVKIGVEIQPRSSRPVQLNDVKEVQFIKKQVPKQMSEIEANLWKNNIKFGERKHKDYLDISNEDFSQHLTTNIEGRQVNPSTFNIFRDSLKHTAA